MAIRVGGSTPAGFYVGGSEVSRLYQGAELVWEPEGGGPPPPSGGLTFDATGGTPGNAVTTSDAFPDAPTVVNGSLTYTASGRFGTGWEIPGNNDNNSFVWDKGAGAAAAAHSVGFWFYPASVPSSQTRLCRLANASTASGLVVSEIGAGSLQVMRGTTGLTGFSYTIPAAGVWYWISFYVDFQNALVGLGVWDESGASLYNGGDSVSMSEADSYSLMMGRITNSGNFGAARFDTLRWIDTAAALIDPVMA